MDSFPAAPPPLPILPSSLNPAKSMHARIVQSINDFERDLDDQHEVGGYLVSFGPSFTFSIQDVGYWGPDLVIFYGVDTNGKKIQLLQHVSQTNILLIAVAKKGDKAKRVGFHLLEQTKTEEPGEETGNSR
jgi:hypothetical protein